MMVATYQFDDQTVFIIEVERKKQIQQFVLLPQSKKQRSKTQSSNNKINVGLRDD